MIAKPDLKVLLAAINLLLWKEWDPIGCGVPKDEYASYANVVTDKALNGASEVQILDYLYWAETDNMSLSIARGEADKRNRPLVTKILLMAQAAKGRI